MRLKKIKLVNYRCFEELELHLHPRLTVLVGENGAGKTAILDGIAAGLLPVSKYLSSADQRLSAAGAGIKDTDFLIVSWAGRGGKERWGASDFSQIIMETTSDLRWDYWRRSSKAGREPQQKIGESELKKHIFGILSSLKTSAPNFLPVFAYYGAQRGRIEIPGRLHSSKKNYIHPTSALVDALDSLSNFKEMLKWFDVEESNELRANRDCKPDEYKPSLLLNAVRGAVGVLLGNAYRNPRFNQHHKFVLESITDSKEFQVAQLSQGYQSMLTLAMDFARRLALANSYMDLENDATPLVEELKPLIPFGLCGKDFDHEYFCPTLQAPAIMLIDEVDLHLHPSWQQRVLTDLMRTFPGTQFIVTTHSPQVLTTVSSECIRILDDGKIYAAPAGTEGAEPSRLLRQVLGVEDVRPLNHPATKELKEYLALVDNDQWASPRAVELRRILDQRYQGNEPALIEADLHIENRKWELGE